MLLIVVAAISAAIGGYLLAPGDWTTGPGSVSLSYHDKTVIAEPLLIGSTGRAEFVSDDGTDEWVVVFAEGVPVEGHITAWITLRRDGEEIRLEAQDVDLSIILPDLREEQIPVVQWAQDDGLAIASRRPSQDSAVVLGLLGVVVVFWVTEAIPLFATALLIPVVLVVSGAVGALEATAPFANPIIVLFFAGFLMAEAMKRTGLDHLISVIVTARAGRSPRVLFATMLGLAAFLSMWMSNTAAAAVLIPIAIAISEPLRHAGFRRALVLGIAYAATLGGVGSAIGTPANQLAIEFLDNFADRSISFTEWFGFGLPMVVLFLPVIGLYLWRKSDLQIDPAQLQETRRLAQEERAATGRLTRDQLVLIVVFGAVALGWVTETVHGIDPGIVALAGAIALFLTRRLQPDDLGNISWSALLTFGGGLTLGLALVHSGASDYLASRLIVLAGLPSVLSILALALATLVLTTVASNTASAAILIPVAIPLAGVIGLDPTLAVVVVAIASSVDFALVIGTPPTMIAYSTRLFRANEIFRKGAVLDLAAIAVLVLVVIRVWELIGVF